MDCIALNVISVKYLSSTLVAISSNPSAHFPIEAKNEDSLNWNFTIIYILAYPLGWIIVESVQVCIEQVLLFQNFRQLLALEVSKLKSCTLPS